MLNKPPGNDRNPCCGHSPFLNGSISPMTKLSEPIANYSAMTRRCKFLSTYSHVVQVLHDPVHGLCGRLFRGDAVVAVLDAQEVVVAVVAQEVLQEGGEVADVGRGAVVAGEAAAGREPGGERGGQTGVHGLRRVDTLGI